VIAAAGCSGYQQAVHSNPGVGADCLSNVELARFRADELDADSAERCSRHLTGCESCRAREASLAVDAAENVQASTPRHLSGAFVPHRAVLHPRRLIAYVGLAACAALTLGLWPFEPPAVTQPGEPELGLFIQRGTAVERGADGDVVYPDDEVRFVYTSDRVYFLALFSVAADSAVVYFPSSPQAREVGPGTDVAFELGVHLDAERNPEHLVGVFCEEAVAVEPLRAALAAGSPLPAAGCRRAELTLHKPVAP
jgi:hypothetical protein